LATGNGYNKFIILGRSLASVEQSSFKDRHLLFIAMSSKSKRAHRGSRTKIVVNVQDPDPDVDPIVASFPGGLPEHLEGDGAPKFAWRKLRETSKRGRILVGEDSTCRYQARSEGRGYDGRRTKLCVGLYNKRTGKLTLHQAAEKGTVFCLEQSVRSYQDSATSLPDTMSFMDRRRALFESFGSSKKQRVLKSQEANVVNVDSVVGAGSVMMGAFLEGQNMSESNRQALEQAKSGTKVCLMKKHVMLYQVTIYLDLTNRIFLALGGCRRVGLRRGPAQVLAGL
jgi:hypothetical protein